MVERYADGEAAEEQFARLDDPASIRRGGVYIPYLGLKNAHQAASGVSVWVGNLVSGRSKVTPYNEPRWLAERAAHADLLRDVFLLFRSATLPPDWLSGKESVIQLAQTAYAERQLPEGTFDNARLQALADALEKTASPAPELVAHLRLPTPHVRGCWAVDMLMGRR